MRRLFVAITIMLFGLAVSMPLISARTVYAADCADGSSFDASGQCPCAGGATLGADNKCVCPSGNSPETDGTCSVAPFAQACLLGAATASTCKTDPTKNPVSGKDGVIFKAINIFSFIIGVASVVMVLVGGLRYVISNGDSNNIATAKNTILYAIIGIVVFLLSRGIIVFVVNKL
ncbi:MAG: hypothetical protein JWO47_994 [Candidatus Saccharibacteria bacterium]|nr:hypothetical protein [Candidatus Saccharibacteria bacterium]